MRSETSAPEVRSETSTPETENEVFIDDYTKPSVEEFIKENRDALKEHLESLIKDINEKVDIKLKNIYDVRLDHLFAVKKLLGWWSSFFDDSKIKPVNLNKEKPNFYENPRYVLTLFIRDLIDNVIYREDLTFKAFKKIINDFEKRKKIKFQMKRNLLMITYGLLKEEDLFKNPSISNIIGWILWININYFKTRALNLLLWED